MAWEAVLMGCERGCRGGRRGGALWPALSLGLPSIPSLKARALGPPPVQDFGDGSENTWKGIELLVPSFPLRHLVKLGLSF